MVECSHKKDDGSCSSCALAQPPDVDQPPKNVRLGAALDLIRHKLLVMSGKGGVGKSSVAVALALDLARRGFAVGLMDVDLHGPNVMRMLGLGEALDRAAGQYYLPGDLTDNLRVVSIEALMANREAAVIWRGPVKHKVIEQFITDVDWGPLDFLIIDAPPGTGDEPLSVAHTIPDAMAVIVTTPQEISLADVRKSINFCRKVDMRILGLVENMSRLVCPDCGKEVPLFKRGAVEQTARTMEVSILGSLPFDHLIVEAADAGQLATVDPAASPFLQGMAGIAQIIMDEVGQQTPQARRPVREPGVLKFAVSLAGGQLAPQFNQSEAFAMVTVREGAIEAQATLTPPDPHPGMWPMWLDRQGVTHILTQDVRPGVQDIFTRKHIEVVAPAPGLPPEDQVRRYLAAHP